MKIITPGVVPVKRDPWPVGETFVCPKCGCRFQVELQDCDRVKVVAEKRLGGRYTAFMDCPNPDCREPLMLNNTRSSQIDGIPITDRR